jgi:hypothetical protein
MFYSTSHRAKKIGLMRGFVVQPKVIYFSIQIQFQKDKEDQVSLSKKLFFLRLYKSPKISCSVCIWFSSLAQCLLVRLSRKCLYSGLWPNLGTLTEGKG